MESLGESQGSSDPHGIVEARGSIDRKNGGYMYHQLGQPPTAMQDVSTTYKHLGEMRANPSMQPTPLSHSGLHESLVGKTATAQLPTRNH